MESPLESRQAIAVLVRDIEARGLPQALALLEQVRNGAPCLEDDQVFLVDLLYAVERLVALALGDDDLHGCEDARRLCDCVKSLTEDIIAAALANEPARGAGTHAPEDSTGDRLAKPQRVHPLRKLPIAS
jgi:hypothetical protein